MWFTEDYVFGGNTRINATWVGDSQTPMFDEAGPKCWMHKQAAWIPDFWPKDADAKPLFTPGVDSSFFYFPEIDAAHGKPVLGGGDMFVMFNDRPEVRAFDRVAVHHGCRQGSGRHRRLPGGQQRGPGRVVHRATRCPAWPRSHATRPRSASTHRTRCRTRSVPARFWKGMVKWVSQNGEGHRRHLQRDRGQLAVSGRSRFGRGAGHGTAGVPTRTLIHRGP